MALDYGRNYGWTGRHEKCCSISYALYIYFFTLFMDYQITSIRVYCVTTGYEFRNLLDINNAFFGVTFFWSGLVFG